MTVLASVSGSARHSRSSSRIPGRIRAARSPRIRSPYCPTRNSDKRADAALARPFPPSLPFFPPSGPTPFMDLRGCVPLLVLLARAFLPERSATKNHPAAARLMHASDETHLPGITNVNAANQQSQYLAIAVAGRETAEGPGFAPPPGLRRDHIRFNP